MSNYSQQQQALSAELQAIRQRMHALQDEQSSVDAQLEDLYREKAKYQLLAEITERLDKLEETGGGKLFWAEDYSEEAAEAVIQRARATLNSYNADINKLQDRRRRLQDKIAQCEDEIFELDERAENLRREEEEAQFEFEITRQYEPPEFRPMVMPWHTQGEDERRFRRCLFASLLVALLLGYLVPLWKLPEPEKYEVIEIPERLAKLVLEKKTNPKPPEPEKITPKVEQKKPEPEKQEIAQQDPKPNKAEKKEAGKRSERAGILAFKDNFQDLIEDDLDNRLGPRTQLSTAGKKENRSQRSLITASATTGSGGIDTAEISRNAGGTGQALAGVAFTRVESSIGTEGDFAGEDRPRSERLRPTRTDEEIQIVFDRYKASLYRIYNRELRENPALQGKMVLRITIEPDGSVSMVKVESSDMDSPSLNAKIVARVKRFNFGPKEGVPPITILYPIDFLPAA